MPYDSNLANRIREHIAVFPNLEIEEKEMFKGLTFMVNGKMCVCVSGENMMCRYDPALEDEVAERRGYLPMVMKGKEMRGYCYVEPNGFKAKKDFEYWVGICLDYNERAKASKKKK